MILFLFSLFSFLFSLSFSLALSFSVCLSTSTSSCFPFLSCPFSHQKPISAFLSFYLSISIYSNLHDWLVASTLCYVVSYFVFLSYCHTYASIVKFVIVVVFFSFFFLFRLPGSDSKIKKIKKQKKTFTERYTDSS